MRENTVSVEIDIERLQLLLGLNPNVLPSQATLMCAVQINKVAAHDVAVYLMTLLKDDKLAALRV